MSAKDVFETWRENEEHVEHWKEFYKGSSWLEWRLQFFAKFNGPNQDWYRCSIANPEVILEFRGGPFRGWKNQYYGDCLMPPFKTIAKNPKIAEQPYIRNLSENFPKETIITALNTDDFGMFVIEGMHRCAAVALALEEGREIDSDITVIVSDYSFGELVQQFNRL